MTTKAAALPERASAVRFDRLLDLTPRDAVAV
jgi:hypothetical protein